MCLRILAVLLSTNLIRGIVSQPFLEGENFEILAQPRNGLVSRSVLELAPWRMIIPKIEGGDDLRSWSRAKRQAAVSPPAPEELRPDELEADVRVLATTGGEVGESIYPAIVTPNVTCLTTDDMKLRLRNIAPMFAPRRTRKCPRKLPCQQYTSCSIWRTGFVTKAFALDNLIAENFYRELFAWVHSYKMGLLIGSFDECVKYYALDQPFTGKSDHELEVLGAGTDEQEAVGHTHDNVTGKKKQVVTRREVPTPGEAEAVPSNVHGTEGSPGTEDVVLGTSDSGKSEPSAGLTDCHTRVEDFLECFDTIMLKGLCYWPTVELA